MISCNSWGETNISEIAPCERAAYQEDEAVHRQDMEDGRMILAFIGTIVLIVLIFKFIIL